MLPSYEDVRFNTLLPLLPSYEDSRFDTSLQLLEYAQWSRRCRTVRVRQVRQVVAVIEDVKFDTSLPQFVYVKFVKALSYSSGFKYVKPLQFSSCFVKPLEDLAVYSSCCHSSQDIAATSGLVHWPSIAYIVPVHLVGSSIRDHLRLRTFDKWCSLPTTN